MLHNLDAEHGYTLHNSPSLFPWTCAIDTSTIRPKLVACQGIFCIKIKPQVQIAGSNFRIKSAMRTHLYMQPWPYIHKLKHKPSSIFIAFNLYPQAKTNPQKIDRREAKGEGLCQLHTTLNCIGYSLAD